MINESRESLARTIGTAVAIAGLSALATKLVEWGLEAVRRRAEPRPEPPPEGSADV